MFPAWHFSNRDSYSFYLLLFFRLQNKGNLLFETRNCSITFGVANERRRKLSRRLSGRCRVWGCCLLFPQIRLIIATAVRAQCNFIGSDAICHGLLRISETRIADLGANNYDDYAILSINNAAVKFPRENPCTGWPLLRKPRDFICISQLMNYALTFY